MRPINLILALAFLATALGMTFYFNGIVDVFAISFHLGWVFSTLFLRFLIALFFVFALREVVFLIRKKRTKFWILLLIGIVPGFFLSFIEVPIYAIDYGLTFDGTSIKRRAAVRNCY